MIIDSSALIAIIRDEPERRDLQFAASYADSTTISAATWLETSIVAQRYGGQQLVSSVDAVIKELGTEIASFTAAHAAIAREAYSKFGKGSGHRAQLNLGDCFAYALARATGEPLLFKGDDFVHTDVVPALS